MIKIFFFTHYPLLPKIKDKIITNIEQPAIIRKTETAQLIEPTVTLGANFKV